MKEDQESICEMLNNLTEVLAGNVDRVNDISFERKNDARCAYKKSQILLLLDCLNRPSPSV